MTICKNVVQFANPADHARLRANLAQEHEANGAGNRALAIRLSRQFHLILAEVGRNPVLSQYLEELTMRTSLVLGLYGSDQRSLCAVDEHAGILDAIERRDEAAVCREIARMRDARRKRAVHVTVSLDLIHALFSGGFGLGNASGMMSWQVTTVGTLEKRGSASGCTA